MDKNQSGTRVLARPFFRYLFLSAAVFMTGMLVLHYIDMEEERALELMGRIEACDENSPVFMEDFIDALATRHYDPDRVRPVRLMNMALRAEERAIGQCGLQCQIQTIAEDYPADSAVSEFERRYVAAELRLLEYDPSRFKNPEFGLMVAREMLQEFGSSHAMLYPPEDYEQYGKDFDLGMVHFIHLGLSLAESRDPLCVYVERVVPYSPADNAGIRRFDIVKSVGDTRATNLAFINEGLRNPGQILLSVHRSNFPDDFQLVIGMHSAEYPPGVISSATTRGGKKLLHIAFYEFKPETVEKIVRCIADEKPDGLILDIRNNRGGELESLEELLAHFLPKGPLPYTCVDRSGNPVVLKKQPSSFGDFKFPVVILINERTFSAAEVFVRVMCGHGRARAVGTKTAGCVEQVDNISVISSNTYLRVPTAKVLDSNGVPMEGHPFSPKPLDCVRLSLESVMNGRDAQLESAMGALQEEIKK